MIVIICKREAPNGNIVAIPIMKDEGDSMAIWETETEARDFERENILCQSSETFLIDLETYEIL